MFEPSLYNHLIKFISNKNSFNPMKNLYILFFLLISIFSFGQSFDDPKILPPSPNAASLGKFGQVPVGLFTGTSQINIPIYEAHVGKLTLPISLGYSSNGIRVDEMSSNVGLGWNLNAGGVITRNVNDGPDEEPYIPKPTGFPNDNTEDILNYIYNFTNPDDGYDTQSDHYSFNFNGYSGTFYLDELRVPIQNNSSPLKIIKDPPPPYTSYEFIIIDPYGVTYCFGNTNSTEKTSYRQIGGGHSLPGNEMATSWYLSKIENVFGDEINLTYTTDNITYDAALSQSVIITSDQNNPSGPGQNLVISRATLQSVKLHNIVTNKEEIQFAYSSGISAVSGNFNKLDNIQVKYPGGIQHKKFAMGYDIITSSLQSLKNPHIDYRDHYGKRLFLKSITEYGEGIDSKNPYIFSYYDPDLIPPRFSYAQDYWGYYNGITNNRYLVSDGDYFFAHESNAALLGGLFQNVGGNKKPNGSFGKNGLLKKVIYPTGGFSELFYEPHSYYGTVIIPPPSVSVSLNPSGHIKDCEDDWPSGQMTQTYTTEEIPFTHSKRFYPELFDDYKVRLNCSVSTTPCWECDGGDWHPNWIRGTLEARNAATGQYVKLYHKTSFGNFIEKAQPLQITGEPIYVDLEEGITYIFKSKVFRPCVEANISFRYFAEDFTQEERNIEIGGSRIQKIITDNGEGIQEIKKYHYGTKDCLDCSSGKAEKPIPSIAYTHYSNFTPYGLQCGGCGTIHEVDQLTLSSGNLYNLYSRAGHQIGYTSVIEEYGENFEGGGILHKFYIPDNEGPYKERDSWPVPGTPFDKNFGSGNELEIEMFSKINTEYKTLRKTVNHFKKHPFKSIEFLNYNIRLRDIYGIGIAVGNTAKINAFDIYSYYQKSAFLFMDYSITSEYNDNGNPKSITTTQYYYDNPDHLQPTRVVTTRNGDNKVLIKKTDYPGDVPTFPYMLSLKNQHRIAEPIRV
ncbi:MAG TPA: hypothetical protein DCX41_07865, partial [Aequorivita sp.]|nr:hypothetical protein [Aequorivita sp.]